MVTKFAAEFLVNTTTANSQIDAFTTALSDVLTEGRLAMTDAPAHERQSLFVLQ